MNIAIPIVDGKLCLHFGHCQNFALVTVDDESKAISGQKLLDPPAHEPGVLPKWLHEQGATIILAGGMGSRAKDLFTQNEIQVVTGCPVDTPESLVAAYLSESLTTGDNTCDH
jgi:ATP-binding protein involved in chromosome partitioning